MITGAARVDCAILVVSGVEGAMSQTKEHLLLCKHAGVKSVVVYINKADQVKDPEMFDLIEMEMRDLLTNYGFDGKNSLFVRGSALCALEGRNKEIGEDSITALLDVLDTKMPLPDRKQDLPFRLSVEHTIYIKVIP